MPKSFTVIFIPPNLAEVKKSKFGRMIENLNNENLPPGIRPWGNKYKASVFQKSRSLYVGLFKTIGEAKNAQMKFMKKNKFEKGKSGRPKKAN